MKTTEANSCRRRGCIITRMPEMKTPWYIDMRKKKKKKRPKYKFAA